MEIDILSHYLVIDKGEPYKKGERIRLADHMLIGRPGKMTRPDVAFDSGYVSRKHALVSWDGDCFQFQDLDSKHGTQINGVPLEPNRPQKIRDGDQIHLAKGLVTMVYKVENDYDDRTITLTNVFRLQGEDFFVDPDKREVWVDGAGLNFSGKEMEFLLLLYRNLNRAVSYDEIKAALWAERKLAENDIPDVGNDEINALVYRLRKRLGRYGEKIVTVTRFGILLKS